MRKIYTLALLALTLAGSIPTFAVLSASQAHAGDGYDYGDDFSDDDSEF